MNPAWFWVSLPYATFGVCVQYGRVTQAPPIARWSLGRAWVDVERYFTRKGGRIVQLP